MKLYLDLETYSEVPITHGTYRYAERAEVLLLAFAIDDGPVEVWDLTAPEHDGWRLRFQNIVDAAGEVVIHNSSFDRTVLRHCGVNVPVGKVTDTMVLALEHSLPGSLGVLCEVLGVPSDKAKDKAGKRLIQLFTKPQAKNRKLKRLNRGTHPEEWLDFVKYARLDVGAMRDVFFRLPNWNNTLCERVLWLLDQRANDRGVRIDLELARSAFRAFERTARSLAASATFLTGGTVSSLTQRQALVDYLDSAHDFSSKDMTKATVSEELKREDLAPEVRELLEIRQQAAATSPSKYKVLLNATSSDGRLRGTIQFCGASRSGRDSGRLFQPQNLPRPTISRARLELGIQALKADCEDLLFDNVSELCASAVRGCIIASAGMKLVVSDLSNIEGRVAAWLAGEEWKLQAFRDFDAGVGPDLYSASYARAFNVSVEEVTANKKAGDGRMRQIGKILELSMGYQGAVGAFAKMGGAATGLSEDEVLVLVRAWRKANSAIVRTWYNLEDAAKGAIRDPKKEHLVGRIAFDMAGEWLRMRLPSGRYLSYPNAKIDANSGRLTYAGTNQFTRKWETLESYGGKLFENACQAVARDVFKHGARLAADAGYELLIPVHDENVTEAPDTPEYSAAGLSALMCKHPLWALGLPLAAAGHEMYRYAKLD